MDNYERKNRVDEALRIRGMKQVELVEKTGIGKTSINGYVKQRWQPKQKALSLMAKVLDVSEMWLAGYDVPMERPVAQVKTDELAQLIHKIRKNEQLKKLCVNIAELDESQFNIVNNMVNELLKVNSQQK